MKSDPQAWADTFSTNVTSQFFVAAAFLPLLSKSLESTPGFSPSIVNITSISGVMKGSSNGQFAYASSKAAFLHLTRMMATTFVEAKVRVNSIAPGVFPSEMTAGDSNEHQKSKLDSEASNPAGRYGHDTDMGACILFLAGPGGVFMNGQVVYPDGGEPLRGLSSECFADWFREYFGVASVYLDNIRNDFDSKIERPRERFSHRSHCISLVGSERRTQSISFQFP